MSVEEQQQWEIPATLVAAEATAVAVARASDGVVAAVEGGYAFSSPVLPMMTSLSLYQTNAASLNSEQLLSLTMPGLWQCTATPTRQRGRAWCCPADKRDMPTRQRRQCKSQ
jgi:hypothetical protein